MKSKENIIKDSVIVNKEKGFLQVYSYKGFCFCKFLDDAWKFNRKSKIAQRIAKKVNGEIVSISQFT